MAFVPLTINRMETKALLLAAEGEMQKYARRRRICKSTLGRILLVSAAAYPYQSKHGSKFQSTLRKLQRDGYLVEEAANGEA